MISYLQPKTHTKALVCYGLLFTHLNLWGVMFSRHVCGVPAYAACSREPYRSSRCELCCRGTPLEQRDLDRGWELGRGMWLQIQGEKRVGTCTTSTVPAATRRLPAHISPERTRGEPAAKQRTTQHSLPQTGLQSNTTKGMLWIYGAQKSQHILPVTLQRV